MNILLTTLGLAMSHIVVVFIALVCVLSLIAMVVTETRSKHGPVQPLPRPTRGSCFVKLPEDAKTSQ